MEILANIGQIPPEGISEAIHILQSAYTTYPESFIDVFNAEFIGLLISFLQIPDAQVNVFAFLRIIIFRSEEAFEYLSSNNIFGIMNAFLSTERPLNETRYALLFIKSIIDLFIWHENVVNKSREEEEEEDNSDNVSKYILESGILNSIQPFCSPEQTFLNDSCAEILSNLSNYENLYSAIVPLLIPLASSKSAAFLTAISTLITIMNNGNDQIIEFIFNPSNNGFIEFLKSVIMENGAFSVDAIRFFESIALFDETGPAFLMTHGIIEMLFEMLQCDEDTILNAIFAFFEALSRTATNVTEILDILKTIDLLEYCASKSISVKKNALYMYLAFLRIGPKEYFLEIITPEIAEMCFEIAECDKNMESIVRISFRVFMERSESEEFNEMLETISCDHNFELDMS